VQGAVGADSYFDDVYAGAANPLFVDVNNNGIDDAWETLHGFDLATVDRSAACPSNNGLTIVQAYIAGFDPNDYYCGVLPTLTSLMADTRLGTCGSVSIKVTKSADGSILANAPITFTETAGTSLLSATPGGTPSKSVVVLTDGAGIAQVYMPLSPGQSDVIVATAQSGSNTVTISIPVTPALPSPPDEGMRLWLDAGVGVSVLPSGSVIGWQDLSGNDNNAAVYQFPMDGLIYPTMLANALNGLPVMHFSVGTYNASMTLPNFMAGAAAGEVFVVVRATNAMPGVNKHLWIISGVDSYPDSSGNIVENFGSDQSYQIGAPPVPIDSFHLYNVSAQAGSWFSRFNGVIHYSAMGNTVYFNEGADLGSGFDGDIAELIVYDHVLSDSDRTLVTSYFGAKYALFAIPTAPTEVTATAVSSTQANITWKGSPTQVGVTYKVNRSTDGGAYVTIGTVTDSTSYIDNGLIAGGSYSYTVVAGTATGSSAAGSPFSVVMPTAAPDFPATGLRLWLRADAGIAADVTGNLAAWSDQSKNGYLLSPTGGGSLPQLMTSVLNGRPVVHFGGNGVGLPLPDFMAGAGAGEVFVVLRSTAATPGATNGFWQLGGSGGAAYPDSNGNVPDDFGSTQIYQTGTPTVPVSSFQIYNVSAQPGSWINRYNGVIQYASASNTVGFTNTAVLGRDGNGNWFNGDIAEMMVYDHVVSSSEREAVETYLATKYMLPTHTPAAPIGVAVTAISSTQASITWQSGPNNNTGVSYMVERSVGGGAYVPIGSVTDSFSYIDTGLTGGVSYSYAVVASDDGGVPSTPSQTATVVTPTASVDLPTLGLRLWLRADSGIESDSNGNVFGWWDQSENENDAVAVASGGQPTLTASASNGRPAVHFNGNGESLALPDFMAKAAAGEAFVVLRAGSVAANTTNGLWQVGTSGGAAYPDASGNVQDGFGSTQLYQAGTPPVSLGSFQVYNVSAQAGSWTCSFNGSTCFTSPSNTVGFTSAPVLGGNGAGGWFNGDVAEVIVYDHVLTAAERVVLNAYLTQKYVTPAQSWPYAADPDGDADGDGVPNKQDARPADPTVGRLNITITTPADGSTI
jgi:hypothetical protein